MEQTTETKGFQEGFVALGALKPKWGWVLASGLVTVLFGLLAFWIPLGAVYAMTLLFGAYAMADGVLSIIAAVQGRNNDNGHFWPLILRGVLGMFAGAIVLILPGLSAVSLVIFSWTMLAVWSIVTGVLELAAAIRLRKEIEGEWMLGLSGLISLALGIAIPIVLWNNPAAGIVTMGWMIGFYALMHGALEISLALALRKLANQN
ncbi:MAG TPA: HdeD family acid-resistance protein [Rhodobacteraceae bacterium]|nr:HdeD family acid-resistance protein [Paracoccaceae bacterium]